jgi:hypothetical protein
LQGFFCHLGRGEQSLQKGAAPAAPRSGPETFAQLSRHDRPFQANPILQFPPCHVKAKANFVIRLHHPATGSVSIKEREENWSLAGILVAR